MARIAINGISARSGGGKSVLRNLLGALRAMPRHDYVVFVPAGYGYETLAADNIAIRPIEGAGSPLALLRFNLRTLPRLLREERSTALFNPADVIVPTTLPQVFLFDWPYAAFPKSPAWHRSARGTIWCAGSN